MINNEPNFNRWITYKVDVRNQDLDPKIMDFLPPELLAAIQRDIQTGEDDNKNKQEEVVEEKVKKVKFDYNMVNCNHDLKTLTEKLKNSDIKQYGLLLYGVSGSGKSMFGQFLAQELKMPFIKKKASDLIDKYVGQTEQNIKNAFKEARDKKAILLFDEADSFLFDRRFANREYEIASVNELLTQMEDHPYPFIMTTNLKDKIDNASMRRFIFKIKYDYMTNDNIRAGIKTYFGKKFKISDEELKDLKFLCAGDFKVVKAKLDILENKEYTKENILKYLKAEQDEKNIVKDRVTIKL